MNDIKEFRIGTANYVLENDFGSKLKLTLNYAQNSFRYRVLAKGKNMNKLITQAGIIANNMLSRKAQRNLSYKLLELKI